MEAAREALHDPTKCQRQADDGRCRSRNAAPLGAARLSRADRHQVRLRHGALRCLHRARRRPADAQLHHAARRRHGPAYHHDRRHRPLQDRRPGAGGLGGGERAAVRLLPVGADHERRSAAACEQRSERRADRCRDGGQHLPLRDVPSHPRGDQARGQGHRRKFGMIANASRREFFKTSGALVLALALPDARAEGGAVLEPNAFVRIGTDNTVTVIVKHLEMGQGTYTGLPTRVAEGLDADWSQMRVEGAPADAKRYNNLFMGEVQLTGGSTALANSYEQLRKAGATARAMLVGAAAERWRVPASEITVSKGVVEHRKSKKRAKFGELAAAAATQVVPVDVALKDPKDFVYIGKAAPTRTDARAKSTGTAIFTQDVKLPGMLTAVVLHPPRFGAKLARLNVGKAK